MGWAQFWASFLKTHLVTLLGNVKIVDGGKKRRKSRLFFRETPEHADAVKGTPSRVTRWDEFSPNGRLFTKGWFSKVTNVGQIFGLLFRP
jgi:hypothetical protein